MSNNMKLSPPWITYSNLIQSLLKDDPDVSFKYDEEGYELKILVEKPEKADALMKLLPSQKEFGNVVLKITVVPADESVDYLELFRAAFKDNPHIAEITSTESPLGDKLNFVVFKKEVVQFFNDDISDIHGVFSALNEDIARTVFSAWIDNVYFCTDVE